MRLAKFKDENLIKLIEECGELIQISSQRFTKPNNYSVKHLVEEMGDVLAQIRLFQLNNPDLTKKIQERANFKIKKFRKK